MDKSSKKAVNNDRSVKGDESDQNMKDEEDWTTVTYANAQNIFTCNMCQHEQYPDKPTHQPLQLPVLP
jgi:hypothetical protein